MNNLRRLFSIAIVLITPFALVAGRGGAEPSPKTHFIAYVGNYTNKTESRGIYEFRFDAATGKMTALELAGETKDPSWVVLHPSGKFLYAANETGKASTVSAFSVEPKSGKLTLLNSLPALGEDPCHLSFDRTGKFLFVANYSSGNVVAFPILADGKLGEHTGLQQDRGTLGPNKARQEAPHAHWIGVDRNNLFVSVSDLGLDRILIYSFDQDTGAIRIPDSPFVGRKLEGPYFDALYPGTGPRHVAVRGRLLYVLGELQSTVSVFYYDTRARVEIQRISTLPAGFSGRNDAAEIEIHPNDKFLYVSNRGHDSIVVYAIDSKTGMLTQVADVPTGGKEPRHFAIDPSGNFLLAENQNSNTIVEFRIDLSTGKLTPTGEVLTVPSPICLAFLSVE